VTNITKKRRTEGQIWWVPYCRQVVPNVPLDVFHQPGFSIPSAMVMSILLWEVFWSSLVVKKLLLEVNVWPVWRKDPGAGEIVSTLSNVLPLTSRGHLFIRGMLLKQESIGEMAGVCGKVSVRTIRLSHPFETCCTTIPAIFIRHCYKSVPFTLLMFIEIQFYLYYHVNYAYYLTGFLSEALRPQIDVVDLMEMSEEEMDHNLKIPVLTYGSA
jgi:hypothetical protein